MLEKINKYLTREGMCKRTQEIDFWNSMPLDEAWNKCERSDWMIPVLYLSHKGTDKFNNFLHAYGIQSTKLSKGVIDEDGNKKKLNVAQVSLEMCLFIRNIYPSPKKE